MSNVKKPADELIQRQAQKLAARVTVISDWKKSVDKQLFELRQALVDHIPNGQVQR